MVNWGMGTKTVRIWTAHVQKCNDFVFSDENYTFCEHFDSLTVYVVVDSAIFAQEKFINSVIIATHMV